MDIGKILSFISPAAGAVTGEGLGKALPFLSPLYGMISGKGPFASGLPGVGASGLMGMMGGGAGTAPNTPPVVGMPQHSPSPFGYTTSPYQGDLVSPQRGM